MQLAKSNDEESKKFWMVVSKDRAIVEQWPEWKRNLLVTKYSIGFNSKTSEEKKPVADTDQNGHNSL
jgi:hypothetical protein